MPRVTVMPKTAYNRTLAMVRDYPRMCEELIRMKNSIGIGACNQDGMPKGNEVKSAVEKYAIRLADLEDQVNTIKVCIDSIPEDMRNGILNNIYYRVRYPLMPSDSSWSREKQKFLVCAAEKLGIYVE